MKVNSPLTSRQTRKSLKHLIIAYSLSITFILSITGAPFAGFFRKIAPNDFLFSVFIAIPSFFMVFQLLGSLIMERSGKRFELFFYSILISRFLWIPMSVIAYLFLDKHRFAIVIIIFTLLCISNIFSAFGDISFNSYLSDILPRNIAGRYLSTRTAIVMGIGAVGSIAAGLYLGNDPSLFQFMILFTVLALAGIADIFVACFAASHPPVKKAENKPSFTKMFSLPFKDKNYRKFMLFSSVWVFGFNLCSAFANVYSIEILKVNYFMLSVLLTAITNACVLLFIRFWGKMVDSFGNKAVLTICTYIVTFTPVLWLFANTSNRYVLIAIIGAFTGSIWHGIDLSILNFSFWLSPEKNRTVYIAMNILATSFFSFAASITGGIIMQLTDPVLNALNIPFINGHILNKYHVIFILAILIRFFASTVLLKKVKEEAAKPPSKLIKYMISAIVRPFKK